MNMDFMGNDQQTSNVQDESNHPNHWLRSFWLHMLNNDSVTLLSYRNLLSMIRRQELTEIPVQSPMYNGRWFQPHLPFSWAIKSQVDGLLQNESKGIISIIICDM